MALAFFEVAHGSCGEMTLTPFWHGDLQIVDELWASCEVCKVLHILDRSHTERR